MFERMTDQSRRVVVLSHVEARDLGDDAIRAEHLLLAVLTGGGVGQDVLEGLGVEVGRARRVVAGLVAERADAAALEAIGIDLGEVRRRAEESFGSGALDHRERPRAWRPGRRRVVARTLSFSTSARAALDGTPGEADRRGDRTITDGHVLLALLARDQAPAARLLRRLGVEPAQVRDRLEEAMAPSGRPGG